MMLCVFSVPNQRLINLFYCCNSEMIIKNGGRCWASALVTQYLWPDLLPLESWLHETFQSSVFYVPTWLTSLLWRSHVRGPGFVWTSANKQIQFTWEFLFRKTFVELNGKGISRLGAVFLLQSNLYSLGSHRVTESPWWKSDTCWWHEPLLEFYARSVSSC